jgi:release factor glutamine methyltransferase
MTLWTLAQWRHEATKELQAAGIEDARLEAEVLLRHTLHLDRAHLYARLQEGLSAEDQAVFRSLLARRLAHEPTAYIVGQREFYGLDLETTPDALIPRPETELLVDEALRLARSAQPETAVDVGTGCGAVAVALATHLPAGRHGLPQTIVHAVDESERALALAARNVQRLGLAERVRLLHGDLLDPLPEPVDLIVANLPYVKTSDWQALPPEIRDHEPRSALDAGPAGMEALERLLRAAPRHLRPGGRLLAEIGWDQGERMREMAAQCFPGAQVEIEKDLAGLDRLLVVDV